MTREELMDKYTEAQEQAQIAWEAVRNAELRYQLLNEKAIEAYKAFVASKES